MGRWKQKNSGGSRPGGQEKIDHGIGELKQFSFDVGGYKDAAAFADTIEELAGYLQRKLKSCGALIGKTVRSMEYHEPQVPEPTADDKKLEGLEAKMWMAKWEDKK